VGRLFLLGLVSVSGGAAIFRPWVGIVAYYLLAILGPQYIWWWVFEGLRVSLIVALATLSGVFLSFFRQHVDLDFLINWQNCWLGLLWFCIAVSFFLGPYVSSFASAGLEPHQLFSITNTIFVFYFCATLEINDIRKLKYLTLVFAFSTFYLTYWANHQYFSENWAQFNTGRLMGPSGLDGGNIYKDENAFAMLFVTGLPFIYYLGWECKKRWLSWILWAIIPLGWHAVFLTGSRGGLVGIATVMFSVIFLSKKKIWAVPLMAVFLIFYQWQAGDVLTQRSQSIVDFEGESSAEDRLHAWAGGLKIIADHPIVGVGIGSFITALPEYHDIRPMVAHNTFIQFAAESGVGAGLAYIVVVGLFFVHALRIHRWCPHFVDDQDMDKINLYNKASTASFSGLIVCSLFLSLNVYEIFFVLLLFNNALYQICLKKVRTKITGTSD
jgi:O-antigen ligase